MTTTLVTLEQLQKIMPIGKGRISTYIPFLNLYMAKYSINTPKRIAAFIAQIAHESGEFLYTKELASGTSYTSRADLGNTKPEAIAAAVAHNTTTGPFYKGHGLIQVTGYTNHLQMSKALFNDDRLVNSPELLCQPEWAVASACYFWCSHNLNALADEGDFSTITKKINGGLNGWSDRLMYWTKAKLVFVN